MISMGFSLCSLETLSANHPLPPPPPTPLCKHPVRDLLHPYTPPPPGCSCVKRGVAFDRQLHSNHKHALWSILALSLPVLYSQPQPLLSPSPSSELPRNYENESGKGLVSGWVKNTPCIPPPTHSHICNKKCAHNARRGQTETIARPQTHTGRVSSRKGEYSLRGVRRMGPWVPGPHQQPRCLLHRGDVKGLEDASPETLIQTTASV